MKNPTLMVWMGGVLVSEIDFGLAKEVAKCGAWVKGNIQSCHCRDFAGHCLEVSREDGSIVDLIFVHAHETYYNLPHSVVIVI